MAAQADLCQTWSEAQTVGFLLCLFVKLVCPACNVPYMYCVFDRFISIVRRYILDDFFFFFFFFFFCKLI